MKSPITTHVLDTAKGQPAVGLPLSLHMKQGTTWNVVTEQTTNEDGRVASLIEPSAFKSGTYRMVFDTQSYFASLGCDSFYPVVQVEFTITDTDQHYHVPLLLSPFGYSTYRGS
jgi:5-hydroxyisourate hydrolase